MDRSPTPLDLMRYCDGELEADVEAQVQVRVGQSERAQAIVGTYREIGELVREAADRSAAEAGADDIADLVMARLEEPAARPMQKVRELRPRTSLHGLGAVAVMAGGLAMAAGIALLVWQFAGHRAHSLAHAPTSVDSPTGSDQAVASAPQAGADLEDREPGVSVDLIEFGTNAGTIFYVPTATGTTTVVWLTDDDPGGSKE
jgi:hypothetical protein